MSAIHRAPGDKRRMNSGREEAFESARARAQDCEQHYNTSARRDERCTFCVERYDAQRALAKDEAYSTPRCVHNPRRVHDPNLPQQHPFSVGTQNITLGRRWLDVARNTRMHVGVLLLVLFGVLLPVMFAVGGQGGCGGSSRSRGRTFLTSPQ